MKKLHKAALIRAYRCALNTLLALIPAGFSVNFVAGIDWQVVLLTIAGMVCTAAIAGCIAFIRAVASGLPEVYDDAFDEDELALHELQNSLTDEELGISEKAGE